MGLAGGTRRYRDAGEMQALARARAAGRVQRIDDASGLRRVRASYRMTVVEFARALGLFPNAVLAWESGTRPMPAWVSGRIQTFCEQSTLSGSTSAAA